MPAFKGGRGAGGNAFDVGGPRLSITKIAALLRSNARCGHGTEIDDPNAGTRGTLVGAINASDEVAGSYLDSSSAHSSASYTTTATSPVLGQELRRSMPQVRSLETMLPKKHQRPPPLSMALCSAMANLQTLAIQIPSTGGYPKSDQ